MIRLPDTWLDDLRARTNIVDVVGEYVQLKPKGSRYWGLCPFHNEKTASFSVDAVSQLFYCFGCHKGGNVIHFVMEMERLEFMEAVKLLAERAHMQMPQGNAVSSSGQDEENRALRERIYEANQAAAHYFHDLLWTSEGAQALDYLHRRGLDDRDIRRFGLGASGHEWDAMTQTLTQNGFDEDILVAAGLTVRKESRRFDMFRRRAIFPIINAQGKVLGFGGRALDDSLPKYLNTPDTSVFNKRLGLYAMNFVKKERGLKQLILVEGYMDVVSLRKYGIEGVVATLGTALTQEQARLMKRFAPEVFLSYDGDSAGQKAILRGLDICEEQNLKCRVLSFPEGLDPDEFIRKYGVQGFQKLKPISPVEYRMLREADGVDMSDQQQRMRYAIACCNILKKVTNPVELEMYLKRLTVETGFSLQALQKQIGVSITAQEPAAKTRSFIPAVREENETEDEKAQRTILCLLSAKLISPQILREDDFDDPLYRNMAAMLLEGKSAAAVLDTVEEAQRERAARALNKEVLPEEQKALDVATDCLRCIRDKRTEREIVRLTEKLKESQGEQRNELLKRIQELQRDNQTLVRTGRRE